LVEVPPASGRITVGICPGVSLVEVPPASGRITVGICPGVSLVEVPPRFARAGAGIGVRIVPLPPLASSVIGADVAIAFPPPLVLGLTLTIVADCPGVSIL
jgi:hypothetical protein